MKTEKWQSMDYKEQEKIASINESNSTEIYTKDGEADNDIPENTHCIVYCHGTNTHGWAEINKTSDLGLEALIAKSWIKISDLL